MIRFLLFAIIFAGCGSIISFFDILLHNVRTTNDAENRFTELLLNFLMEIKHPGSYLSQRISSQQEAYVYGAEISQQPPSPLKPLPLLLHYLTFFQSPYGKNLLEEYIENYTITKQNIITPTTTTLPFLSLSESDPDNYSNSVAKNARAENSKVLNPTRKVKVQELVELDEKIDKCIITTLTNLTSECPKILEYYTRYQRSHYYYWIWNFDTGGDSSSRSRDGEATPTVTNNQLELSISYDMTTCSIYMDEWALLRDGKPRFEPHTFNSCPREMLHPNDIHKCVNLLPLKKYQNLFISYFGGMRSMCNSVQQQLEKKANKSSSFKSHPKKRQRFHPPGVSPKVEATQPVPAPIQKSNLITIAKNIRPKFKYKLGRRKLFIGSLYADLRLILSNFHDVMYVILSFYYSALNPELYPNHFVYKIWFYLRLTAALIISNKICFNFLSFSRSGLEYLVVFIMSVETLFMEKYFNFPTNVLPYTEHFNADDVVTMIDRFRVYGILFILAVVVKLKLRKHSMTTITYLKRYSQIENAFGDSEWSSWNEV